MQWIINLHTLFYRLGNNASFTRSTQCFFVLCKCIRKLLNIADQRSNELIWSMLAAELLHNLTHKVNCTWPLEWYSMELSNAMKFDLLMVESYSTIYTKLHVYTYLDTHKLSPAYHILCGYTFLWYFLDLFHDIRSLSKCSRKFLWQKSLWPLCSLLKCWSQKFD